MGRLRGAGQRSSATTGGSKLAGGGGGASGYGDADVAKLKGAIQTLCQSTHPLGECGFRAGGEGATVVRGRDDSCFLLFVGESEREYSH